MAEIFVKLVAEIISILSIATKEMQQSRTKTYLKKLVGRTDIEDALKRLDCLTREEVRMAIAQVLKGIDGLRVDAKKADENVQRIVNNLDELKVNLKDGLDGLKDNLGEIKDDMCEIKWTQIEKDVRKWFSSPDPSVNYNIARSAYQEGTVAWFL